jgi:hypothetical protein
MPQGSTSVVTGKNSNSTHQVSDVVSAAMTKVETLKAILLKNPKLRSK